MQSWRGGLLACAVLPMLAACRGTMVQEYFVPTAQATATGMPTTTRVRTTASGPVSALCCLAQNQTLGQSAAALHSQSTSQSLALREAWLAAQVAAAQSAGHDLKSVIAAAGTTGLAADQQLRALNLVAANLGSAQAFATLAEAQAFFATAAGGAR